MCPSPPKISVLLVCWGNICRSPMAEAVFRNCMKKAGLEGCFDTIDSAGTSDHNESSPPDERTIFTLRKHGIETAHTARGYYDEDFDKFDYFLGMDATNMRLMKGDKPEDSKAKVMLFGEFSPIKGEIIVDPWYGKGYTRKATSYPEFEEVYQQCVRCTKGFAKQVLGATEEQLSLME